MSYTQVIETAPSGLTHFRNTLPWLGLFILGQTIKNDQPDYTKNPEHSIDTIPEYEQEVEDDSQLTSCFDNEYPPFINRDPAFITEVITAMHNFISIWFTAFSDENNEPLKMVSPFIATGCLDDETGEPDAHENAELARQFEEAHENRTAFFSWMYEEEEVDPEQIVNKIDDLYSDDTDSEWISSYSHSDQGVCSLIVQLPLPGDSEGKEGSQQSQGAGSSEQSAEGDADGIATTTIDGYPAFPMSSMSGYQADLNHVKSLICPACHQYHSKLCQFDECGHRAGEDCLKKNGGFCLECQIKRHYRSDAASSRDLNSVPWHCGNRKCCYFGERKDLFTHAQSCADRSEPCEYCKKMVYLPELKAHRWECREKDEAIVSLIQKSAGLSQSISELKALVGESKDLKIMEERLTELETVQNEFSISCFLQMESLQKQIEQISGKMSGVAPLRDDGQFLFVIPDIPRRHGEAISKQAVSLISQSFYSEPWGYKLALKVYLNGDGDTAKGRYISCFLQIKKGEYDERLSWPFRHSVRLILEGLNDMRSITHTMHSDLQSSSFQCPQGKDNQPIGIPQFARQSVLEEGKGFVKNGKMFIKCIVLPSRGKMTSSD